MTTETAAHKEPQSREKPPRVKTSTLSIKDFSDTMVSPSAIASIKPNSNAEVEELLIMTGMMSSPLAPGATEPAVSFAQAVNAGMIVEIALQDIDENPFNARVYYASQDVDDMAVQLRQNGQLVPAIGYLKENRVILTDGQKRLRGARAAGLKTLQVSLKEPPASPLENYLESRSINLFRSSQTPLDDARQWQRFLNEKIFDTQSDLAKKLCVSEGLVSQTLSLNRISQRVKMNMLERPETHALSIGYEISRLFSDSHTGNPDEVEQMAMDIVSEVHDKGLTSKQVRGLVDSMREPKKQRNKPDSRQFKYGGVKGSLKLFEKNGQLELSIRGLSPVQLEDLAAQIERITAIASDS